MYVYETVGRKRVPFFSSFSFFRSNLSVCQRAAGYADMVPFLHVSDSSYGLLQLVRTVAKWFKYTSSEKVRQRAKDVLASMDKKLFSRAHDECLALVDDAMDAELVACCKTQLASCCDFGFH